MAHPAGIPDVFSAADLASGGELFRSLEPPARLCIFGDPIAQSASPQMQGAALRETGRHLQYVRVRVTPDELPEALGNLAAAGFLGANLTMPHKQAALGLLGQVNREAALMGAVNTVAVRDGSLHGFNTDGPGFAAAVLEEFGIPLGSLRVLVLGGGGGAGRAITVQCALEGCPRIVIANRTPGKAAALAETIAHELPEAVPVESVSLDPDSLQAVLPGVDLIVNATPLGMKHDDPSPLPDHLLRADHLVYDTVYSGGVTGLLAQATAAGARGVNGLSMLLHQGVLAFGIWFGEPAPIESMRAALDGAVSRKNG